MQSVDHSIAVVDVVNDCVVKRFLKKQELVRDLLFGSRLIIHP